MKIPTYKEVEQSLEFNLDTQEFILKQDLFLRIFGIDIIIPKGLTTDGASFPFFIDIFVKGTDKDVILWAILHDYAYRSQFIPRILADMIFAWGLSKTKNKFLAYVSYIGLRLFGWYAWMKNKNRGLLKFPDAKKRLLKKICKK